MNGPSLHNPNRDRWAVALAIVYPSFLTWVYFVLLARHPAIVQQVTYSLGKAIQFGFPVLWVFALQRRRMNWTECRLTGAGQGIAFGVVVLIAMLALYHGYLKPRGILDSASSAVRDKVVGFDVDSPAKFVALGLFYSLGHSFLEEYYWRWFVFGELRRLVRLSVALFGSSAAFTAHHVIVVGYYFGPFTMATCLFSLAVAVGGVVWAWLYHRYGSLLGIWLSHLVVDAAIFIVGYDMVRSLLA
jgi:membrane protease YdiL (CAAX protease family)